MRAFRFAAAVGALMLVSAIGLSAQTSKNSAVPAWDNSVTWKVNFAKSKDDPPELASKSFIVKREPFESGFKVTADQIDGQGKATHTVTVGKYDGKDNPVQGLQPPRTQAYRLIDGGYEIVGEMDGKTTNSSQFLISRDGKTIRQTQTGKN